jgi:tagatose 6-phosphate kinase
MILCIGTTPAVQRVMVFGKLTLDAVNRASNTLDGIAGKSINVVKVLKMLGARPVAVGLLGGARGEEIRRSLAAQGIEAEFISVMPVTRQCITVIDESASAITELVEESKPVPAEVFHKLAGVIQRRASECRAMVMSGTIAPGGTPDFYRQCVETANACGVLSVVDAQRLALAEALKARPGLVKPNRQELAQTLGTELKTEAEIFSAMGEIHSRGAQRVVITAGKEPALASDSASKWRIRSPLIRPVNPIGSGDAFTAALVWRLVRGEDLGEACRWAAAAGAANALTLMPGDLALSDVERLAREVVVERL